MRPTSRPTLALAFAALVLGSTAPPALGQQPVPGTWGTDGAVHSLARDGNTLYVGGNFTQLGPIVGAASHVGEADGALISGFPLVKGTVTGTVNVAASDGAGGWYLGGSFTSVGGVARRNAARVLADGSVASWDPSPDGAVNAIAVGAGLVYLGGAYQNCGGAVRANLAAVNTTNGAATNWNPAPDASVNTLVLGTTSIYVGGAFFFVAGVIRNGLAEIRTNNGNATGWSPSLGGGAQVNCMLLDGGTMYVGGAFTNMGAGNDPRRNAAAVLTSNATATAWDPDVSFLNGFPAGVHAMAISGGVIYVGGRYDRVGGQPRASLVAVDKIAGAITAFDAQLAWQPFYYPEVHALALGASGLHVGGSFLSSQGVPRANLVTVDAAGTPLAGWRCHAAGQVNALASAGGTLLAGGDFAMLGTKLRRNLAAVDLTTGQANEWDPGADNIVAAIAPMPGRVYVGGWFTSAGGQPRTRLAALDPNTGLAQGWNPGADNFVLALAVSGANLYAGGGFRNIAGSARVALASFDTGTGALRSWGPVIGTNVAAILPQGSSVFVGGDGVLTRLDGTTGLPDVSGPAFSLSGGRQVQSLAVDGGTLYVGGAFTTAGWAARDALAAVDVATGTVTPWNPAPDIECGANVCPPIVNALGIAGGLVYAGGEFQSVGGAVRTNFAVLDPITGLSVGEALSTNGPVLDMTAGADIVALGGAFMTVGGAAAPRLALLTPIPPLAAPPQAPSSAVVLAAPSPNPMLEQSQVRFALPAGTVVRVRLLDAAGRAVRSLLEDTPLPAGPHAFPLRRDGLAPGFYVLELRAGAERTTRPVVILN